MGSQATCGSNLQFRRALRQHALHKREEEGQRLARPCR